MTTNNDLKPSQQSDSISDIKTLKSKKPKKYRVLLYNDDYTPMDFVIFILERYFHKSRSEATSIMLATHNNGVGECGVYPFEIAETKVTLVTETAKKNHHPLKCIMESQQ